MEGGSPSSHHGRTDGRAGPLGRRGAQRPQRQGPAEGAEAKPHARGRATLNSQHLPESLQWSPRGVRPHLTREGAAEADTGAEVSRGQAGDPTRVVLCLSRVPQLCPSLLGCSFPRRQGRSHSRRVRSQFSRCLPSTCSVPGSQGSAPLGTGSW